MSYNCDYSGIKRVIKECENTDGDIVSVVGYEIPVLLSDAEVDELLNNYDPESGTSPLVAYSRPLSRAILDGLLRKKQEEE